MTEYSSALWEQHSIASWEEDWGLRTWLIALVLIVLLISCSSNCIWGEITVLVNSSTLELRVMSFGILTASSSRACLSSVTGTCQIGSPQGPCASLVICHAARPPPHQKQVSNCLSLNKTSFSMQRDDFNQLNGLPHMETKGQGPGCAQYQLPAEHSARMDECTESPCRLGGAAPAQPQNVCSWVEALMG